MNIDDFKSNWQNKEDQPFNETNIELMTKVNQHPSLRKVKLKLIVEAVLLTALLFLYYDGFDGDKKPFLINALLVASIVLYVVNNMVGYWFLKNPDTGKNFREMAASQKNRLKNISLFSMASSVIYSISLLTFLTSQIVFDQRKYILLAGIVVILVLMLYFSWISWQRKIGHFVQLETEFQNLGE